MIGRFLILVLVSVTASGLWWALWAGHRSRLRDTVRAEPTRALVFTSPECAGCRTQEAILESLDPELRNRIRRVAVTSNPEEAGRVPHHQRVGQGSSGATTYAEPFTVILLNCEPEG